MCGRTACTLAPDEICRSCSYRSHRGDKEEPKWRDPPGGQKYYPCHNIAPSAYTPVIISSHHKFGFEEESVPTERVIQPMQWGLVPSWHKGSPKKVSYETNNCRSESMMEKPTYKVPLQKGRRCVVLADGFFEWKRDQAKKQPYYIHFPESNMPGNANLPKVKKEETDENGTVVKHELGTTGDMKEKDIKEEKVKVKQEMGTEEDMSGTGALQTESVKPDIKSETNGCDKIKEEGGTTKRLMTMAGVFDVWKPSGDSPPVLSYSVITVESSPAMMKVHHRMPAFLLNDKEIQEWLDYENIPLEKAIKHIRATEEIQMHPVSDIVNNARNKSPDCTKPIDPTKPKSTPSSNLMMKWLSKGKREKSDDQPPSKRVKTETD
ncbi:abasic site processing protein HMCES-like [Saccostrea echinata]|uniref:abasic site processing protein HMCES-like n=1 Tax=Saccostrea echinata TaxID=191078 RepID=UPI002A822F5E|nr:abasic site processing protein HMCES-like [Saccostrea echinata]